MSCDYKVVHWNEIKDQVKAINPEFYELAEEIEVSDNDYLYKLTYSYGCEILKRGVFQFPSKHNTLKKLDEPNLPKEVKEDLDYAFKRTPLAMVLDKSVELFIDTDKKIFPWQILTEGNFFAVFSLLEQSPLFYPAKVFSITSGARNVFMLPNIGNKVLHKNIKNKLQIRQPTPKGLMEHWDIFRSIYDHAHTKTNEWKSELLLFPKHWIQKLKYNSNYKKLYTHIVNQEWKKTAYLRHKTFYDLALSQAQEVRNLKPNPYLLDTVKHILAVAAGGVAGFQVAANEQMLPLSLIKTVYDDIYKLRSQLPVIFQPGKFSIELNRTTYYSLQLPTTLEFSPKSCKDSSTIHDLCEIKHILNIFIDEINKGQLSVEETILGKIAQDVTFRYFHSTKDDCGDVDYSYNIPKYDFILNKSLKDKPEKQFAATGTFVRGCITISKVMATY